MAYMLKTLVYFLGVVVSMGFFVVMSACSSTPFKPCTSGGQPPREGGGLIPGTIKRCFQVKDGEGVLVNDGEYYEWYSSDNIAITGKYDKGKKIGRWIEYDKNGKVSSDKYFKDGKPVSRP